MLQTQYMIYNSIKMRDVYKGGTTSTTKSWGRKYLLKAAQTYVQ